MLRLVLITKGGIKIKYLLVGKDSLLATMIVAHGLMGFDEVAADKDFVDKSHQQSGSIISVGKDSIGNEIFCAIHQYPGIVVRINEEIKMLKESPVSELRTIPVLTDLGGVPFLIALSRLPGIGAWFDNWARSSVLSRKQQLIEKGQVLRVMNEPGMEPQGRPAAAKPQI